MVKTDEAMKRYQQLLKLYFQLISKLKKKYGNDISILSLDRADYTDVVDAVNKLKPFEEVLQITPEEKQEIEKRVKTTMSI